METLVSWWPKFGAVISIAALASAAISGCSNTGDKPEPTEVEWTEPAWMAEQTQKIEEIYQSADACLVRRGWEVEFGEDLSLNTSGMEDAERELVRNDWQACLDEAGYAPQTLTAEALTEVIYPRELDIQECLKAHDVPVSEPPPVEIFVEQHLASREGEEVEVWQAWKRAFSMLGLQDGMSGQEFEEMQETCPQLEFLE